MKRWTKASLALATSLSAVGVLASQSVGAAAVPNGGSMVVSQYQPFDNQFIPQLSSIAYTAYISAYAFDGLMQYDNKWNIVSDLAKTWKWSADQKTLTINLDPKAKWSDGQPITADDVLLYMNFLASPAYNNDFQGEYGSLVGDVVGASDINGGKATSFASTGGFTKINQKTFAVHFSVLNPHEIPFNILFWTPLPSHILGKIPFSQWQNMSFDHQPSVSSGPYKFAQVSGTDSVTMSANPNYLFGKPHVSQVIWKTVNPSVALGELQQGQIDYDLNGLQPTDMQYLSKLGNVKGYHPVDQGYFYMGFKTSKSYLSNPVVRQAFTYAVNRQAIVDGVVKGMGIVANGPLTPSQFGYTAKGMNQYGYSPAMANKLLDKAGWKKNASGMRTFPGTNKIATLTLGYPTIDPQRTAAAIEISQDLRKVGVRVDFKYYPKSSGMYKDVEAGAIDMWMGGWLGLGPVQDVRSIWSYDSAYNSGFEAWNDPKNEALLKAAYAPNSADGKVFKSALTKWSAYVNQQMPVMFLWDDDLLYAMANRVHIPAQDNTTLLPLRPQDWYLQ